MKKICLLISAVLPFWALSQTTGNEYGQKPFSCTSHEKEAEVMSRFGSDPESHPEVIAARKQILQNTRTQSGNRGGIVIIPVVFHIAHTGGIENISDAQVYDALAILNRDFRKLNADTVDVVAAFKSIVADCEIEFRLAQLDAQGNCVSGITRTYTTETNVGTQPMVEAINMNLNGSSNVNNVRFPPNKYLNVWICANPDGAAGYTIGPFAGIFNQIMDGVFVDHSYFGSIGTSSPLTSRALTHEVGHWLNLSHTWGSTNNPGVSCGNDNVSDTPTTEGWSSCNLTGATCGSPVDNVQNYMEYSYCCRMFTEGQKSRMQAALVNYPQRANLILPSNLTATGTDGTNYLCAADFKGHKLVLCPGDSIQFSDLSYHGATGWTWTFTGGTPSSSNLQNPSVVYNTPGTYDVTLSVTDGSGIVDTTKIGYITVLGPGVTTPYFESFETMSTFPSNGFFRENADNGPAWELYSGAGASGNQCLKLDNFSNVNDDTKDAFISSNIDLSMFTSVTMTFFAAYCQKSASSSDLLRVSVSNNCGQSWIIKKNLSATAMASGAPSTSPFTPNQTHWWLHYVTGLTPTYLTSTFRYKFELQSGLGNNVWVDDIFIHGPQDVNEVANNGYSFTLMPNPVETEVALTLNAPQSDEVNVELTDMTGRIIYENKNVSVGSGLSIFYIPVEELSSGVYLVNVYSENMRISNKLIRK